MSGADMVIASVDKTGKATLSDRYAIENSVPKEDECQDWKLLNGYETKAGTTIIEMSRLLNTTDVTQDNIINAVGGKKKRNEKKKGVFVGCLLLLVVVGMYH